MPDIVPYTGQKLEVQNTLEIQLEHAVPHPRTQRGQCISILFNAGSALFFFYILRLTLLALYVWGQIIHSSPNAGCIELYEILDTL